MYQRGRSSSGRASGSQSESGEFESRRLHLRIRMLFVDRQLFSLISSFSRYFHGFRRREGFFFALWINNSLVIIRDIYNFPIIISDFLFMFWELQRQLSRYPSFDIQLPHYHFVFCMWRCWWWPHCFLKKSKAYSMQGDQLKNPSDYAAIYSTDWDNHLNVLR